MRAKTDIDPPPRPKWRLSNPASVGDRLVFSALTCYRAAIREGRYTVQHEVGSHGVDHLERRMQERDIDLADVLHTVAVGRICVFAPRSRDWIGGGYLLDGVMVYVQAPAPRSGRDFADLVPSICSAWRVDPPEPCRPLTVSVGELARLRSVEAHAVST